MHGIKARKPHHPNSHLDLKGWYTRKRKMHVDAQIRNILDLHRVGEAADIPENHAMLPPVWSHKTEALTGDTVYVGHNNLIRSFILSALNKAEPEQGKVSITSPIGRALLGRHPGEKVYLRTLDGDFDYTILKII